MSNIKIYSKKYNNSVKTIDIDNIKDNDYVYLINFNEGSFPIKYKDEDYLSDKEKSKLNISTSSELNENETINITNYIKKANHLTVTYSKYNLKGEIFVSSIYNEELFDEENKTITWYSDETAHKVANYLKIKKETDCFIINFNIQENIDGYDSDFNSSLYDISIRFRNSGSRYDPFNIIFMRMYERLKR